MTPQAYVGGLKVDALAPIGDLTIMHSWPSSGIGGPTGATFSLILPPSKRPAWLVKDAVADVNIGGLPIVAGKVSEVDWDGGQIDIDAAADEGADTACLTSAGDTSSTPDTVINAAISRGALTWSLPASISTTPLTDGDSTANLNKVRDLLAAYADASGARLYVDAYRRLLAGTDPTTPGIVVLPGAGELPWASESQATRIIGRWISSARLMNTTIVGSGAVEKIVDMTAKGPLNSTRATAILTSVLTRMTSGGWAGSLTLASEQIAGGPHLGAVADQVGRGLMVRLLGQRDPRPGAVPVGYVDFIVESSSWNVADGTITLTPRGIVARDLESVLADDGLEEAA